MYVCVVACLAEVIMCMFVFQKWGTQQHPNPLFFMYRKTIGLGDPVQKPYLYRSINGWSIYRVCFKNCAHPWNDIVKTYLYIDQPWNFRVLYTIFQINPDTSIIYIYVCRHIIFWDYSLYDAMGVPWCTHYYMGEYPLIPTSKLVPRRVLGDSSGLLWWRRLPVSHRKDQKPCDLRNNKVLGIQEYI